MSDPLRLALLSFLQFFCGAGTITYFWTVGVKRRFWRAKCQGLLGFAGGLAIDLGWGPRLLVIILFLLAATLIANLTLFYMMRYPDPNLSFALLSRNEVLSHFMLDNFKVLGWGFGLLVDPHSRELLSSYNGK
jgi:hypothetical protein